MTRRILIADRGGWELALDNPDAVVVDLSTEHLRRGSSKLRITNRRMFALLCLLLRAPDILHERAAISQAVFGDLDYPQSASARLSSQAAEALGFLGMTIETAYGRGLILHSEPTASLPCEILARGPTPPTHVRSLSPGPSKLPSLQHDFRTGSNPDARAHSRRRIPSSRSGTGSTPGLRGPGIS